MVKKEILEILDFMKIIYQGRKIDDSDTVIATWEIMFKDYSKNEVISSLKSLVKKSKYVPSIHEILDGIEETFTVEKMVTDSIIVIRVLYRDESIPFQFKTKSSAKQFIDFLKNGPTREDIRVMHETNVRDMNPFTRYLHVDQSDREEFDKRKKNEYYAMKAKQI